MWGFMMSSLCLRKVVLQALRESRVLLQSWLELFLSLVSVGGRFMSKRFSQVWTVCSFMLKVPLLCTESQFRAFTKDLSVFFSPDLSASRQQDLSVNLLSEMPLQEGEMGRFWLVKLRKGTCWGTLRALLAMEVLRGGCRLVVLVKTGEGAGGRGAGSFCSSNSLSFFLAFFSASWPCLRQMAHRQASRSVLNLTMAWKTCSPITQKQTRLPLCSNCCISSMAMGWFLYFSPRALLTKRCLQSDLMVASSKSTFLLSLMVSVSLVMYISALVYLISLAASLAAVSLASIPFFSCSRSNCSILSFSLRVLRQSRMNWLAWTCSSVLLMDFLNLLTTAAAWVWLLTVRLSLRVFMYCFIWDKRTSSSEFIANNINNAIYHITQIIIVIVGLEEVQKGYQLKKYDHSMRRRKQAGLDDGGLGQNGRNGDWMIDK